MGLYQNVLESADGGVFINLRDGSGTAITSTLVGSKQAVDVNIANSVTLGLQDETTFTYGTDYFGPVGGVYQDTSPTLTAGQAGIVRLTADRGMHVNLRSPSGAALGDTNSDGLFVRPGDGTNVGSFSATSEQFVQLRQGGNIADVNASNQLLVLDGNAGTILTTMTPATGTLSQVAVTTTSASLLASNASRKGWSCFNATNKLIYLAMGATSSASAFSISLQPNSYYESLDNRVYTGEIAVIGATSVTGNAVVTEYT